MKKPLPFGKFVLLDRINVGGMAEVFLAKAFGGEGVRPHPRDQEDPPDHGGGRGVHHHVHRRGADRGSAQPREHRPDLRAGQASTSTTSSRWSTCRASDLRSMLEPAQEAASKPIPMPMAVFIARKHLRGARLRPPEEGRPGQGHCDIVHRDVSPQNVLVSYEGEVKVIDFGIAKAAERSARRPRPASSRASSATCRPSRCAACRIDRRSRPLRPRRDALRDADRRAALRGRERLLHAREGAQCRGAAAARVQRRDSRGARGRRAEGVRPRAGGALPVGRRDGRGPGAPALGGRSGLQR